MFPTILEKKILFIIPSRWGDNVVEAKIEKIQKWKYIAKGVYKHEEKDILQIHNIEVHTQKNGYFDIIPILVNMEYKDDLLIEYTIDVEEV